MIPFPLSYALVGVWMIGGLLVPYVVRRPGAALLGELVAAFVSMAIGNQWGILDHGQRAGAGSRGGDRLRAAFGGWKRFDRQSVRLYGAAALAGALQHPPRHVRLQLLRAPTRGAASWWRGILCVVGSVILGGGLSQLLGEALAKTGVLSGLAISRGKVKRI